MKRGILFLMFILAFQIGYKAVPTLAQEDKELQKIKKVIEIYLNGFANKKLNAMMRQISINYYEKVNDNIIDYAKFKSIKEQKIKNFFTNLKDFSVSDLKFYNLDIKGNNANLEIEYKWKAFNFIYKIESKGVIRKQVSLVKENGAWKIALWKDLKIIDIDIE